MVGGRPRLAINSMDQITDMRPRNLRAAPRCGAKNRAGNPCQCPAIRERRRCRLHGGLSPGAPHGTRNGNFRHGEWTKKAIEHRDWLRSLVTDALPKGGTT
jgi:glucans biosynthesis protein